MNADVKVKWLDALRRGKYVQGRGALLEDGRYCCLGVLCDLADPGGWHDGAMSQVAHNGMVSYPCDEITTLVGIEESEMFAIANLNDEGKSFAEIADYIEANL